MRRRPTRFTGSGPPVSLDELASEIFFGSVPAMGAGTRVAPRVGQQTHRAPPATRARVRAADREGSAVRDRGYRVAAHPAAAAPADRVAPALAAARAVEVRPEFGAWLVSSAYRSVGYTRRSQSVIRVGRAAGAGDAGRRNTPSRSCRRWVRF